MKTDYNIIYQRIDDSLNTNFIKFKSKAEYKVFNQVRKKTTFSFTLKNDCYFHLIIKDNNKILEATCLDYHYL